MKVCHSPAFIRKEVHWNKYMRSQTEQELDIAGLIIETLNLEDMQAAGIDPEDYLFGEGLGLDSIDALEIALAIKQKYGINIKSGDKENTQTFSSLAALSTFITENKAN